MTAQPSQVFISYQRTDEAVARLVRDRLVQAGVPVWMDQYDIPVGAYWPDEIDTALTASAIVVGILSPDAVASRNVKNEWDWAIQNDKRLLLLQARPCVLPHRYTSINYIDATGPDPAPAIGALLNALGVTAPEPDDAIPETRYARSGDVNIAYQVIGDGPVDLVLTPGFVSNVELSWEEPSFARYLRRLASVCRLITYDKRGTGLSDRVTDVPTLEERIDDVRAVMDAAGSERAVLMGVSEGGPMSILFAATYPERVIALILYGTSARSAWAPDYPWGKTDADYLEGLESMERAWGRELNVARWAPSRVGDELFTRWFARSLRLSASPGAAVALARMNRAIDVRHALPAIRMPTLVLHRTGDRDTVVERGRAIAAQIPGAHFVELSGNDHLPFVGDQDAIIDQIGAFLAGMQAMTEPDTVLATILVILHASGPGQASPPDGDGDAMAAYRAVMRANLTRFRGRAATTEDALSVATFDGPARAVRCAGAIVGGARAVGLAVRAGLHTGEVEVRGDEVRGGAIEFTKRVAELAEPGELLVSSTVRDLVAGSGIRFVERGTHTFAGYTGDWQLLSPEPESIR